MSGGKMRSLSFTRRLRSGNRKQRLDEDDEGGDGASFSNGSGAATQAWAPPTKTDVPGKEANAPSGFGSADVGGPGAEKSKSRSRISIPFRGRKSGNVPPKDGVHHDFGPYGGNNTEYGPAFGGSGSTAVGDFGAGFTPQRGIQIEEDEDLQMAIAMSQESAFEETKRRSAQALPDPPVAADPADAELQRALELSRQETASTVAAAARVSPAPPPDLLGGHLLGSSPEPFSAPATPSTQGVADLLSGLELSSAPALQAAGCGSGFGEGGFDCNTGSVGTNAFVPPAQQSSNPFGGTADPFYMQAPPPRGVVSSYAPNFDQQQQQQQQQRWQQQMMMAEQAIAQPSANEPFQAIDPFPSYRPPQQHQQAALVQPDAYPFSSNQGSLI